MELYSDSDEGDGIDISGCDGATGYDIFRVMLSEIGSKMMISMFSEWHFGSKVCSISGHFDETEDREERIARYSRETKNGHAFTRIEPSDSGKQDFNREDNQAGSFADRGKAPMQ
ncbi:hypothetical protein E3N88_38756 [Mikania micrantha]|uniref:Uncharacterized protein n=1 Tax=Mikania micrantha TaxID=192012 RepID=A0A5N6LUX4_9ASTR|nr:hypothetical protein E3N88_38756 [Mikania micrantha]